MNSGTPTDAYDYIWFAGLPVAQEDVGGATHWTFDDHLGTPILQTTNAQAIYWQADYKPNGEVFALRTGSGVHQPLRYPGQEAEQFAANGANGDTGRFYNVNRWYRPHWQRYTQPDPLGLLGGINPYEYGANDPVGFSDPLGLDFNLTRWYNNFLSGLTLGAYERDYRNGTLPYPTPPPPPGPQPDPFNGPESQSGKFFGGTALGLLGAGLESPGSACELRALPPRPPGWNENWSQMWGTREDAGQHWFDENGGEWRWHPPDAYHPVGHWDYNPWAHATSPWENIPQQPTVPRVPPTIYGFGR